MAQRESTFINMVLTLFGVTLIAAAVLGFVHDLTKDAIEQAKTEARNRAIRSVLPEFDRLGDSYKLMPETGGDSIEVFPAYNAADDLVGVAVNTYTKNGFSGLIRIMAGIAPDGSITGFEVLEHKETPGLGSKMNEWFRSLDRPDQNIIGKSPATNSFLVRKDGGEIDAITASTITSRAFLEAVMRAWETYNNASADTEPAVQDAQPETEGGEL